jgi:4-amino-4-deoxy-L-arabinose transferase-like glycosyltransferase
MEFTVVGRGDNWVTFHSGAEYVRIAINDGLIDNSFAICNSAGCPSTASPIEAISTNLKRLTNTICEVALVAVLILLLIALAPNGLSKITRADLSLPSFLIGIIILATTHFGLCLYFAGGILDSVPHIPDSAVYFRQALAMTQGTLQSIALPVQPFEAFCSNGGYILDGRLVHSHATHFWPALIAVFIKLGIPGLLGPVLSLLGLLSFVCVVRCVIDRTTALLAGVFFSLSPFIIIQAGEFMMHTCTMSFLLMSLMCWLRGSKTARPIWFVVSGALWGYAFGVRQLTVLGVSLPFAVAGLASVRSWVGIRALFFFVLGVVPLAFVLVVDSWWITGSLLKSPHAHLWGLSTSLSNIPFGLSQMDTCLAALLPISWYSSFPYLFGALVVTGLAIHRDRAAVVAAATMLSLLCAYSLLNTNGMHGYGPRFLFEALPAACFLAARGVVLVLATRSSLIRLVGKTILVLFLLVNVYGLVTILPQYENYNGITTELYRDIAALPPRGSIVVVPNNTWQDMDVAATLYDPSLRGLVVIKQLPDGSHERILDYFKDRRVYTVVGNEVREVLRPSSLP